MKKVISVLLILIMSVSMQVFSATSARFGSNEYCTVKISQKLMNNKKYKTATVKITTYQLGGRKSSGVVNVKLTDGNGNYIGTYKKKSGDTIKLGNDHSSYRIYISEYKKDTNGFWKSVFGGGDNFINSGKCSTWKISNNKNCSIK